MPPFTVAFPIHEDAYLNMMFADSHVAPVRYDELKEAVSSRDMNFGIAWEDDPKRLLLPGFLDKIADGDWFCLVAQGPSVRVNPATLVKLRTDPQILEAEPCGSALLPNSDE